MDHMLPVSNGRTRSAIPRSWMGILLRDIAICTDLRHIDHVAYAIDPPSG